jgi:hypothetical protein
MDTATIPSDTGTCDAEETVDIPSARQPVDAPGNPRVSWTFG